MNNEEPNDLNGNPVSEYPSTFADVQSETHPHERPSEAEVFRRYSAIIRRLRAPGGCPWDRKQTLNSLRRFVIEESFELIAAIHDSDANHIAEELGDVFLVVMLIADSLELELNTTLTDVLLENADKLIRRHPHVFGAVNVNDSDEVVTNWNRIKKEQEGRSESPSCVSPGLPPLEQAYEIQRKAAKAGFDWPDVSSPLDKVREELAELEERITEIGADNEPARARDDQDIENELGDLFFSVVNVSRHLKTDPSVALARTNRRFLMRFSYIERQVLDSGRELPEYTLAELDAMWDEAKARERD